MTGKPKPIARFAEAFAEELGKWAARVVIASMVVLASGFILIPSRT